MSAMAAVSETEENQKRLQSYFYWGREMLQLQEKLTNTN